MSLRIHNTLTRALEDFAPLEAGHVRMYVCGITVYDLCHVGHARANVAFDVVQRWLKASGYRVTFVRNITDIDDKIIRRAVENGEPVRALTDRMTAEMYRDFDALGIERPTHDPRATDYVPQMLDIVRTLEGKGLAYRAGGDVNFAVRRFPGYGKLSGKSLDELHAGERVAVLEGKEDPLDFVLWKAAKPTEPQDAQWDSDYGAGRPGWHIECSAMTCAHLGQTFDIHGGGKDLIFPHHENEIAQSQGAYGTETFARYWLHNGFLNFAGEKMSKSLGNVFGCDHIAEAVGGEALRFFCVKHHYRSPIDFEVETVGDTVRFRSLEQADRDLEYFYVTLQKIDAFIAQGGDAGDGAVLPDAEKLVPTAREALADDFNSPRVMAAMHEAATLANKLLVEGKGIDKQVRRRTIARLGKDLRHVGDALGILAQDAAAYLRARRDRLVRRNAIDTAQIQSKLDARVAARAAKDFKAADDLRAELGTLGIELLDTPQGTDWRVRDDG